jgi:hypothetical protein
MTDAPRDRVDLPDAGLSFAPPMRAHHLTGGLSMLIASNRLAMVMPGGPGMIFFSVSKEGSLASYLEGQDGIRHLGSNYFNAADEMNDAVTQHFTIAAHDSNRRCLATEQAIEWGGIANTLHQSKRGAVALVATRVASQVRSSLARLERLSMAYRTVLLEVRTRQKPPSSSTFTSDKYAAYLGIEYRAMLNELYALRDSVLTSAYRLRFKRDDAFAMRKIKPLALAETSGAAKLISQSMFSDVGDRLIDHMALYRSVAQHCLGATNPIFGDVYQLQLSSGPFGDLPYLIFPLYDDIEKMRAIERGSSTGVLERPTIEEVERFAGVGHYRDALEFCYDCFERLLRIAELLRQEIGVEPQPITITDKEILEITVTDGAGKVTRAKRAETGRLVEY